MTGFKLTFEQPLLLLLIIPALLIIVIPYLMLPRNRRKGVRRILPLIVHMVTAILLCTLIAGMSITAFEDRQSVMVLLDLSDSTERRRDEMVAFAGELLEGADSNANTGLVVFGRETQYTVRPGDFNRSVELGEVDSTVTDIASAMENAAGLMSSGSNRRLILLTDGEETDNSAETMAAYLANQGIRVDTVCFDTSEPSPGEVQVSGILLPDEMYVDIPFDITVALDSSAEAQVSLTLTDGGKRLNSQNVVITPGQNSVVFSVTPETAGIHSYNVTLSSDLDISTVNNSMYAYAKVYGDPVLLIIAPEAGDASLLNDLIGEDYEITLTTPDKAPYTIGELCGYDQIVMLNVDYDKLPKRLSDSLNLYVEKFGRSLLTAGGDVTYMYGGMQGTVIEEMAPVTYELLADTSGMSTAMVLVLDCSSSMSNASNYIGLAKQGAIKCVEAMSSADYVGVVSFNSGHYLDAPLTRTTDLNKAALTRTISGLATARGTYYTNAVKLAYEQLKDFDADIKHVMFLSDGNPSDSGYDEVVAEMSRNGITTSTIALGYSSPTLDSLAKTGGGRYYCVQLATDLPNIMEGETEEIRIASLIEQETVTLVAKKTPVTAELGEEYTIPLLGGYLGCTMREDVDCILVTDDGRPIYAVRQVGFGKSAMFASDLSGEWSRAWFDSDTGRALIKAIVAYTISDTRGESSMSAKYIPNGSEIKLTVNTAGTDENQTVVVTSVSPNGKTAENMLYEGLPGEFAGRIATANEGIYMLSIIQYDADGVPADRLETAAAAGYSQEYNEFRTDGADLLTAVAASGRGVAAENIKDLMVVRMEPFSRTIDPLLHIMLLLLVLLLVDIAVRKLRWKDIVAQYHRIMEKLKSGRAGI